jgi:hypothetical protein
MDRLSWSASQRVSRPSRGNPGPSWALASDVSSVGRLRHDIGRLAPGVCANRFRDPRALGDTISRTRSDGLGQKRVGRGHPEGPIRSPIRVRAVSAASRRSVTGRPSGACWRPSNVGEFVTSAGLRVGHTIVRRKPSFGIRNRPVHGPCGSRPEHSEGSGPETSARKPPGGSSLASKRRSVAICDLECHTATLQSLLEPPGAKSARRGTLRVKDARARR